MDELERRAVAAAVAVASTHGLPCGDAAVLASGSNVAVSLAPAPVVARVMTGTVALHADPERWLRREMAVLAHLAPTGLAVAPSTRVPPGPHHRDGLWLTLVEHLPGAEPTRTVDDARGLGRALRALHDALRPFGGDLDDMGGLRDRIARLLAAIVPADDAEGAEVAALERRLAALEAAVFASELPVQALHGDASPGNLLRTARGPVWNDFEDALRGPVHWDVAGYAVGLRRRGADDAGVRAMLDGYGWGDEGTLAPFLAAHAAYDAVWERYDRQRRASRR
ncbi:aminoglycoside phosphotransferase family protein [Patulibacter sp. SYSU D01012]|uniref:phosphotransferase enzyme family protein n=1 Tax=Patulibacter sp. SYSU D01012 TaxID=2817381 RepID=UPI001B302D3B|nr:aminoglycoside phosphotransferase family protein [Patulibacter sp. SYSU D01012]